MIQAIQRTLITEWFLFKLMFRASTIYGILYFLLTGIYHIIPLISVWIWKLLFDEFFAIFQSSKVNDDVWIYLGIYLLLQILSSIILQITNLFYEKIKRKASYILDMEIISKVSDMDECFFDDAKNLDLIHAAQTSESYLSENISWTINIFFKIVAFISGLSIFLSSNVILALCYVITYIPGAIVSYKQKVKMDQLSIDNIPETRKKNYYKFLLTSGYASKELRLYNLSSYFKKIYNDIWSQIRTKRGKVFLKGAIANFFASVITYIGTVILIIYLVYSITTETMPIGSFALYIGLAQSIGGNFSKIVEELACQIEIDVPHVTDYINFLKYNSNIKNMGKEIVTHCPDIEFRNVYFKYPNNEEYTLNNLSFKINSGQMVALVGVNGAGKTTIIKLLLRFYEPERGEILIDQKNIKEYSLESLRSIFGVCFQDISRFSLTMRENIALSNIEKMNDLQAVEYAAKAAGADKIADSLSSGYETEMTRLFYENGAELSGGQWQKIGLARVFFKEPRFVILDEPSSALDPEAEDHILSFFAELCKNKGGILISHRLSNLCIVDEIILIDKGTVIETGKHEELLKMDGKYSELYNMQAEKYRSNDHA